MRRSSVTSVGATFAVGSFTNKQSGNYLPLLHHFHLLSALAWVGANEFVEDK